MFGLLVAGRLVQTDPLQVAPDKFVFALADVERVQHVAVFLTGACPLPECAGAGVYLCFADPRSGEPAWLLLGFLSNHKPSAIFRLSGLRAHAQREQLDGAHPWGGAHAPPAPAASAAQIGVSVESLEQLAQQTPVTSAGAASSVESFALFARKTLESLVNFAASFALTQAQMRPCAESFIPESCLRSWYETFKRRLERDPNFWRS